MKVAVCAKNDLGINSPVDDRFGRAEYYAIFDSEKQATVMLENTAKNDAAGAGGKAISLLNKQGVNVIVVPELGPKALDAVKAFELEVYHIDDSKTVGEALNAFLAEKLTKLAGPSVSSHNRLRQV